MIAHRLKSRSESHPPLIVRFASRAAKLEVMRNRKQLKGSKITIVDDMCRDLYQVFHEAKQETRVKASWTWNGKVFGQVNLPNGKEKTVQIQYGQSIDEAIAISG